MAAGDLVIPKPWTAYQRGCILETNQSVYGRDSRIPIHDAIQSIAEMCQIMATWTDAIGLCVQDGKLCVIYNT